MADDDQTDDLAAQMIANLEASQTNWQEADALKDAQEDRATPSKYVPAKEPAAKMAEGADDPPPKKERARLVAVERDVTRAGGKTHKQHYWVKPSEVKPTDRIIGKGETVEAKHPYYYQMRVRAKAYVLAGKPVPPKLLAQLGVKHVDELNLKGVPKVGGWETAPPIAGAKWEPGWLTGGGEPSPPPGQTGTPKGTKADLKPADHSRIAAYARPPAPVEADALLLDVSLPQMRGTPTEMWQTLDANFKAASGAPAVTWSQLHGGSVLHGKISHESYGIPGPKKFELVRGGGIDPARAAGDFNRYTGQIRMTETGYDNLVKVLDHGGLVESTMEAAAVKVFAHEVMHGRTAAGTVYNTPAEVAVEEATTEITANHFVGKMYKDKVLQPRTRGITLSQRTGAPVYATPYAHDVQFAAYYHVNYPHEVRSFAAAICAIDGHDERAIATDVGASEKFNHALAVRAMQVKGENGGVNPTSPKMEGWHDHTRYSTNLNNRRIGMLTGIALERAGVKPDHPKYKDITLAVGEKINDLFGLPEKHQRSYMRKDTFIPVDTTRTGTWHAGMDEALGIYGVWWPGPVGSKKKATT